ncbi:hypothetical protein SLS62_004151 [Diatrype stigma]|uniref:Zn(2)-C6 fungal-type domain-containing protein n=1 Tax=Diatrype stigma TaxID=117547 RepID=A0AAN9YQP5_9PEZI
MSLTKQKKMPYVPKANKSSLRRTACDRCRMQKLKCLRDDEGQPRCIRCTRLNVACEVGRTGRPGRPRKPNPGPNLAAPTSAAATNPNEGFGCRGAAPDGAIRYPAMATNQPQDLLFGDGNGGLDAATEDTFVGGGGGGGDFATIGGAGDYDLDLDLDLPPQDSEPLPPPPSPPPELSQDNDDDDSPRINPTLTNDQEITPRYCILQGGGSAPNIPPTASQHECLRELSQLNVDLHAQAAMLKAADPASINLGTFVCATPPPAGDGLTICERSLDYAQRLHRTMGALRWVLNHHQQQQQPRAVRHKSAPPLSGHGGNGADTEALHGHYQNLRNGGNGGSGFENLAAPAPSPPPPPATGTPEDEEVDYGGEAGGPPAPDAPVALLLVSCYAQLVGLLEAIFHHVHRRLASLDVGPMPDYDPAKGVQLGVFYSLDGRLAGMVYAQIVGCLLDRIELGLGIAGAAAGAGGLLSEPRYFELLQRELFLSGSGGGNGRESRSARPQELRDAVERARLTMAMDASW